MFKDSLKRSVFPALRCRQRQYLTSVDDLKRAIIRWDSLYVLRRGSRDPAYVHLQLPERMQMTASFFGFGV